MICTEGDYGWLVSSLNIVTNILNDYETSEGVPRPLTVLGTTRPGDIVATGTLTRTPAISPGPTPASNTRRALTPPRVGAPPQCTPALGNTTGQIAELNNIYIQTSFLSKISWPKMSFHCQWYLWKFKFKWSCPLDSLFWSVSSANWPNTSKLNKCLLVERKELHINYIKST